MSRTFKQYHMQPVVIVDPETGERITAFQVVFPEGATVALAEGASVALAEGAVVALAEGTEVALAGGTEVALAGGTSVALADGTSVALAEGTSVGLAAGAEVEATIKGVTPVGAPISSAALTVTEYVAGLSDVDGGIPATAKWARLEAQCAWAPKVYEDPALTVEVSDRIRYTYVGDAPTSTSGFFLTDGDPLLIPEELLEAFQFVLDDDASEASAALFVTFHE